MGDLCIFRIGRVTAWGGSCLVYRFCRMCGLQLPVSGLHGYCSRSLFKERGLECLPHLNDCDNNNNTCLDTET